MGQAVESWGTPPFQGMQIDSFLVARAILPAPKANPHPGERQGPDSGLM
jgi:hypothetical protein